MKCPKCGYLGFKHVERCPNCGYDFSLSSSPAPLELSIRPSPLVTPQPLADLALVDSSLSLSSADPHSGKTPELGSAHPSAAPTPELPLFGGPIADDVPLITKPSPPRTPLAVRRATPELPRLRSEVRSPMLDLAAVGADARVPTPGRVFTRTVSVPEQSIQSGVPAEAPAGVVARVTAALIDVLLLAGIDLAVLYFTMEICGVTFGELTILPKIPLVAFLIVQNVSYFILFTAGGQTMGQMACGIKVISDVAGASPDLPRAMKRTLAWTILAAPAGLGLATALFTADHRGLHDRFSGTRVVRATT